MRGADEQTGALFSYLSPDALVPREHPLRAIRPLVNAALARFSPDFERLYAPTGRASIAPEKGTAARLGVRVREGYFQAGFPAGAEATWSGS